MNRAAAGLMAVALTAWSGIAASAQPADSQQLQPVIVTAQRRAQNIQSVPIQVTALSGEQLAAAGVTNSQQALNLIPNVTVAHSFTFLNSFVTIRGVSEINNADPPMLVVVDGVAQNSQKQLLMNLFNVKQVQVLMGPQGGLYGQNAIGGVMIITTRGPSNQFHSHLDLKYGNGAAYGATGSFSGPLIKDKLLFSIDGNVRGSGGLIKNTYLHRNVDAVNHDDTIRLRLLALPTSWLTLDLRGDYNGFKGGATWDSVVFSGNANDIQPPQSDYPGGTYGHVSDLAFKFDADLGFATLTGVTGYTNLAEDYRGSLDFTNPLINPGGLFGLFGPVGQGQNLSTAITSQEIHLASRNDQPLRWIVGAYYEQTTKSLATRAFFETPVGSDQYYNPSAVIINRNEGDHNHSWALYGQADYDLTSRLTATVGLRYDAASLAQTNLASPGFGAVVRKTETDTEPKATLAYHFTKQALGYLTYSTGFRGGGFNSPGISAPFSEYFAPETLTNYEAGFKTTWLNRRLIVNGDYYYDVDHNYQFFLRQRGERLADHPEPQSRAHQRARAERPGGRHEGAAGVRWRRYHPHRHHRQRLGERGLPGHRRQSHPEDHSLESQGGVPVRALARGRYAGDAARRLYPRRQAVLAGRQPSGAKAPQPARCPRRCRVRALGDLCLGPQSDERALLRGLQFGEIHRPAVRHRFVGRAENLRRGAHGEILSANRAGRAHRGSMLGVPLALQRAPQGRRAGRRRAPRDIRRRALSAAAASPVSRREPAGPPSDRLRVRHPVAASRV